jgi:hypothetical protein
VVYERSVNEKRMREGKKGGMAAKPRRGSGAAEGEGRRPRKGGTEEGRWVLGRGNTLAIPKWQFRNFSLG